MDSFVFGGPRWRANRQVLDGKPTYRAESLAATNNLSGRRRAGADGCFLASAISRRDAFPARIWRGHILRQRAILQAACGKPSDPKSPFPRRASLAAVARKLGPIEIDDHPAELCECCGRTRHYGALRKPDGFRLSLEHLLASDGDFGNTCSSPSLISRPRPICNSCTTRCSSILRAGK